MECEWAAEGWGPETQEGGKNLQSVKRGHKGSLLQNQGSGRAWTIRIRERSIREAFVPYRASLLASLTILTGGCLLELGVWIMR